MRVTCSSATCGATVSGVDLSQPMSDDFVGELRAIWLEHLVVSFPDQRLDLNGFERVAQRFGPFGIDPFFRGVPGHPHIAAVKREATETTPIFAEAWHSDWSFLAQPPAATALYGRVIPPVGGDTLYADQHAALEALPDSLRSQIEGRDAVHSARHGYAPTGQYGTRDIGRSMDIVTDDSAMATESHPIIQIHPETGRPALFISMGYTIGIEGLDDNESRALLRSLFVHQTLEQFIYRHHWQPGMLTLWDNRSVLHRATGGYHGHPRLLHRITIAANGSSATRR